MKNTFTFLRKYQYWVLAGLIILGVAYSLFHRSQKSTPKASPTPSLTSPLPASPQPILPSSPAATPVTQSPQPSPNVNSEGSLIPIKGSSFDLDSASKTLYYLDPEDQLFKKVSLDGGDPVSLGAVPPYLDLAIWSPGHRRLFVLIRNLTSNDIANPLYDANITENSQRPAMLDLETGKLTALNQHIVALSFVGDDKIIYEYKDNTYNNLSIAHYDGSNWRNLATLGKAQTTMTWAGRFSLVHEVNSQTVSRYDGNGKNLETKTIPNDLHLSQSLWSTDGQKAIYWNTEKGLLTINYFRGQGDPEEVVKLSQDDDDFTILWDNKTNELYLVDADGLRKVGTVPL